MQEHRFRNNQAGNSRWVGFQDSRHCDPQERQQALMLREQQKQMEEYINSEVQGISPGVHFSDYNQVKVDLDGPDCPQIINKFTDIDLGDDLTLALQLAGYQTPTPVQKGAIPVIHSSRDLMACAETGSGKTAAYLLPIISMILLQGPGIDGGGKVHPRALVMVPTRELALQIYEEAKKFGGKTPLRSVVIYGGKDVRQSLPEMDLGCDILVATPGRLRDMLLHDRSRVTLDSIQYLVLDEADRMLEEGFEKEIRFLINNTEMPKDRQTLLFSATFPGEIIELTREFLKPDRINLSVGNIGKTTKNITQNFIPCEHYNKFDALLQALDSVKEYGLTLIFVETKREADELQMRLSSTINTGVAVLHGDRNQDERERALYAFRRGDVRFLVTTNVASRGLDIPKVMHVVNYGLPKNIEDYVHRIGRTGRVGNSGISTGLVTSHDQGLFVPLKRVLRESGQKIPEFMENGFEYDRSALRSRSSNSSFSGGRDSDRDASGGGFGSRRDGPNSGFSGRGDGSRGGGWSRDGPSSGTNRGSSGGWGRDGSSSGSSGGWGNGGSNSGSSGWGSGAPSSGSNSGSSGWGSGGSSSGSSSGWGNGGSNSGSSSGFSGGRDGSSGGWNRDGSSSGSSGGWGNGGSSSGSGGGFSGSRDGASSGFGERRDGSNSGFSGGRDGPRRPEWGGITKTGFVKSEERNSNGSGANNSSRNSNWGTSSSSSTSGSGWGTTSEPNKDWSSSSSKPAGDWAAPSSKSNDWNSQPKLDTAATSSKSNWGSSTPSSSGGSGAWNSSGGPNLSEQSAPSKSTGDWGTTSSSKSNSWGESAKSNAAGSSSSTWNSSTSNATPPTQPGSNNWNSAKNDSNATGSGWNTSSTSSPAKMNDWTSQSSEPTTNKTNSWNTSTTPLKSNEWNTSKSPEKSTLSPKLGNSEWSNNTAATESKGALWNNSSPSTPSTPPTWNNSSSDPSTASWNNSSSSAAPSTATWNNSSVVASASPASTWNTTTATANVDSSWISASNTNVTSPKSNSPSTTRAWNTETNSSGTHEALSNPPVDIPTNETDSQLYENHDSVPNTVNDSTDTDEQLYVEDLKQALLDVTEPQN